MIIRLDEANVTNKMFNLSHAASVVVGLYCKNDSATLSVSAFLLTFVTHIFDDFALSIVLWGSKY